MDNWRIEHLNGLLQDDPKDEFVLYALAQEYLKLEELDKSLSFFLRLKEINQDYVGLYYHLAALYQELDEEDKAMATYLDGISVAQKIGDQHALSELMNAKTNLELGV